MRRIGSVEHIPEGFIVCDPLWYEPLVPGEKVMITSPVVQECVIVCAHGQDWLAVPLNDMVL